MTKAPLSFAIIALLSITLAACDQAWDRSGMADPMSTDSTPVAVMIGHRRLMVPENCMTAPLEASRSADGYVHDRTLLLAFLYPTGECRSKSNFEKFRVGGYGDSVWVLVSQYSRGDADLMYKDHLAIYAGLGMGKTPKRVSDASPDALGGETVFYTEDRPRGLGFPAVIFGDAEARTISRCYTDKDNPGKKKVCQIILVEDLILSSSFSGRHFADRGLLINMVKRRFNEFLVAGER